MSIRIVLAPLFGSDADANTLKAAYDLARRFEAHVVGLYARPDSRDIMPLFGEGLSGAVMEDLIRDAEAELRQRRDRAWTRFEAARVAAEVPLAEPPSRPGTVSTQWREVTGRPERVVPEAARLADLVVFGRPEAGGGDPTFQSAFEATLLGGRRPLLLVPPAAPERIGHSVAIAWNGSAEAAAAVAGAMPLLERATTVHVLTAETARTRAEVGLGLAEYLEWHGVPSERRPVEVAGGSPVGAALLGAAGEAGADLLVMGGYGRMRLSELILGGVTRHVLGHAHLPVLMAH